MEKSIFVRANGPEDPQARKKIVTSAIENDILDIIVKEEDVDRFERLGKFRPVIIKDDAISWGEVNGRYVRIETGEDEKKAGSMAGKTDLVMVSVHDWKVIPIENLIARCQATGTKLVAQVSNMKDARLLLETLESGVARRFG